MSTKIEILRRRERVLQLRLEGLSIYEIYDNTNISLSTIRRDLETLKQEIIKNINPYFFNNMLIETLGKFELINKELWAIYNSSDDQNLKLRTLNSIGDLIAQSIDIFLKLGIIQARDQPVTMQELEELKAKYMGAVEGVREIRRLEEEMRQKKIQEEVIRRSGELTVIEVEGKENDKNEEII